MDLEERAVSIHTFKRLYAKSKGLRKMRDYSNIPEHVILKGVKYIPVKITERKDIFLWKYYYY